MRVGGRYRIVFGGPKGDAHEVQGVYRVVDPYHKLAFTWTWPRSTPERESLVLITLEPERDGRATEMVFRHEQHFDAAVRDNHERGWSEAFAKLEQSLKGEATS